MRHLRQASGVVAQAISGSSTSNTAGCTPGYAHAAHNAARLVGLVHPRGRRASDAQRPGMKPLTERIVPTREILKA